MIRIALIFFLLSATAAVGQSLDEGLEELVANIDRANSEIETMRAEFEQRKEISLLTDAIEMTGKFFLKRTEGMKFEFAEEDDLLLIINQEEMISISHQAKTAERIKLPRRKTDLTRLLISEQFHKLLTYFNIGRVDQTDTTGEQQLVLLPTRRKFKKKINEIRIWVNDRFLIHRFRVVSKDGDIFELSLNNIEINPELEAGLFDAEIPDDYEVGDRLDFIFGPKASF